MPKQIKSKAKLKEYFIVEWCKYDSECQNSTMHHEGVVSEKEARRFVKNLIEEGIGFSSAKVYRVIEVGRTTVSFDWRSMI